MVHSDLFCANQDCEKMILENNKLITILGPTASGKSTLGIKLAQKFNGEIISADSRQVYRGLDIGSGKVTKEEQALVPHHLLEVVDPMQDFSVAHYQKLAFRAIDDIFARNKLPFLVGGTALYIYSVIDNYNLSGLGANLERRKELERKTAAELIVIASEALAKRSNLNNAPSDGQIASVASLLRNDIKNPRRIIRAIEKLEGNQPLQSQKGPQKCDNLILGINLPRPELYKKIDQRVDGRIEQGMIDEVANLRQKGVKDDWLINLGLEYRWITEYLQDKWKKDEMIKRLKGAIHAFSRRQLTWWKRDKRIIWIKNKEEAERGIKSFIKKGAVR